MGATPALPTFNSNLVVLLACLIECGVVPTERLSCRELVYENAHKFRKNTELGFWQKKFEKYSLVRLLEAENCQFSQGCNLKKNGTLF